MTFSLLLFIPALFFSCSFLLPNSLLSCSFLLSYSLDHFFFLTQLIIFPSLFSCSFLLPYSVDYSSFLTRLFNPSYLRLPPHQFYVINIYYTCAQCRKESRPDLSTFASPSYIKSIMYRRSGTSTPVQNRIEHYTKQSLFKPFKRSVGV